jgi:hypothetical protein
MDIMDMVYPSGDENSWMAKSDFKFKVLIDNLIRKYGETPNASDFTPQFIIEISPLLNYENFKVTSRPIFLYENRVYSIDETDDTTEILKQYLDDGKTICIITHI